MRFKRLDKTGKGGEALTFWGLGIVAVLVVLMVTGMWTPWTAFGLGSVGGSGEAIGDFSDAKCDEDGQTALTLTVQNDLNTTGVETYDMSYALTDMETEEVAVGTDTTAASITLNCPGDYLFEGVSASGANGDSSKFVNIKNGNADVDGSGNAIIHIRNAVQAVTVGGQVHGVIEVKARDLINGNDQMCNSDDLCTDYETDGTTFDSTTNGTGYTVGSGGEAHFTLAYRPTVEDNVFGDIGGYWVLVDADTTKWNKPTVKINGVVYSDVKSTLSGGEALAYNGYEYAFLVAQPVYRNGEATLDFQTFALSGVDPGASDDIQIDFASRGGYASTQNANVIKIGSVKDDTSQTVVHQLEDFTVGMA